MNRIGFDNVHDGTWQAIGGPLSGYTVSGFADGSNGVFDLDTSLDYDVVILFVGEGPPSPRSSYARAEPVAAWFQVASAST